MRSCRVLLPLSALALLACNPGLLHAQTALLHGSVMDDGSDAADVPAAAAALPVPPDNEPALPRRPKPKGNAYDPPAIGDGPIAAHASLGLQAVATSNVKGSSTAPHGDVGLSVTPSLTFASNWSRHELHGAVGGDFTSYAGTPSANASTGSAALGGRIDIRRDTTLQLETGLSTALSTPGDPEVPGAATGPARSWSFTSSGALAHDFGPYSAQMKLAALRNAYDDVALSGGGVEVNADRNYWEPSVALRGSWGASGARLKPYVELTYDPRLHDTVPDRNGQNRNSQGGGVALGVTLDDGPIWMGDVSANFIARDYNDPALKTAMALGLNSNLTWSPTPLWSIVASSGVGLNESEQAGVSATPSWTGGLQANYALRENVTLKAGVAFTASSNASVGGLDTTKVASLGADWQLNPYLSLSGSLQSTWYNAANGAGDYSEQRVTTGMVLRH